ncbi:hypothetical protein OG21DRAFT_1498321, partial [Imleria badia]
MSEPLLTKRLHISGITPAITPADLERRLSSFGKVKAMDGFGARNALGDPRKFGFVTMEIGPKELAKCLNVLSGSTWKGAKLRIGEAKPNFQERLAQVNSQPPRPVRLKRTHARNHGHPSFTLPLTPLSATAAASTPGWIATPSGRVVRPMRMRPERPLEPIRSELGASKVKGKVKKRVKPPPARARRRLIDPTKWDSVYLKGVFLDSVPVPFSTSRYVLPPPSLVKHDIVDEEDEEETDEDGADSGVLSNPRQPVPQLVQDDAHAIPSAQQLPVAAVTTEFIDVGDEANAALAMLGKIFGDKEDWDERESLDEMEGLEDNEARDAQEMQVDEEDDIEVVPRDFGVGERSKPTKKDKRKGKERLTRDDDVVEAARDRDVEMEDNGPPVSGMLAPVVEPPPRTNLKALFAPKEDASFSLLDHLDLDLDLELDADILGISAPSGAPQEKGHLSEPISSTPRVVEIPATVATTKARSRVTLDPSLPLLFPSLDLLPHPYTSSSSAMTTTHQHGTPSCFLFPSATRVRDLHHLPPNATFTRSPQDTPESIRERWEKDKSSLTHEWKKAWREARGSRRGRVGAGEIGGNY